MGHDASAAPHAVRRLLGWVGQHPTAEPLLAVRENLLILGRLRGIPKPDLILHLTELPCSYSR